MLDMTHHGDENLTYDVHDAWSRFHHQENVLRLALEGLSPANIETAEFSDIAKETFNNTAEREEFMASWVESQLVEREIARRVLLQSLVASIYGTFEFSIIQLFANYERLAKSQSNLSHGPRVDLSRNGEFIQALSSHGIELSAYDQYDRIELAKEIRHAIMHRGGLVDLKMNNKQKGHCAALLRALQEGWPISGRPYADSIDLVQIDIDPAFVGNLLSVCKHVLDCVHNDLVAKLKARKC